MYHHIKQLSSVCVPGCVLCVLHRSGLNKAVDSSVKTIERQNNGQRAQAHTQPRTHTRWLSPIWRDFVKNVGTLVCGQIVTLVREKVACYDARTITLHTTVHYNIHYNTLQYTSLVLAKLKTFGLWSSQQSSRTST